MAEREAPEPSDRIDTERVDTERPSPSSIAQEVYEQVYGFDFTLYELLCFCLEFASGLAVAIDDDQLLLSLHGALKRFYQIHYNIEMELDGLEVPPKSHKEEES